MSHAPQIKDYVSVVYNTEDKPYTEYPDLLARHLVDRFQLLPKAELLDLGCGRGEFLNGFYRCGLNAYGVDVSQAARNNCALDRVIIADLENTPLPLDNESFDYVFSKSVLEHFYYPEKIAAEIWRLLKPGGLVIIMVPDWQAVYRTSFYEDFTHRTPFTRSSLRTLLLVNGFENIVVQRFRQLPFLWRHRWLLPLSVLIAKTTPAAFSRWFKLVRFSKEIMLLATARKPRQRG